MTLASVARASQVSVTTVSKVLNGHEDVADRTRRKVEAQLQRQGYRRRARVSTLDVIHLVLRDFDSEWAREVIAGVTALAAARGLGVVLVVEGHEQAAVPVPWLDLVARHRPVGVVLAVSEPDSGYVRRLGARGVPCVVVGATADGPQGVSSVVAADWAGGVAAARHLIALGHRRIAAIAGPSSALSALARLDGIRAALGAAGLPLADDWVRSGPFTAETGYLHAGALLTQVPAPTAIVAGDDLQAVGAIQAAQAHRLQVPQDLSVVGFGDLSSARFAHPPLTTVRQPLRQMAYEAAALVVRMSVANPSEPVRVDLATSLMIRGSTAPPAAGPVGASSQVLDHVDPEGGD